MVACKKWDNACVQHLLGRYFNVVKNDVFNRVVHVSSSKIHYHPFLNYVFY